MKRNNIEAALETSTQNPKKPKKRTQTTRRSVISKTKQNKPTALSDMQQVPILDAETFVVDDMNCFFYSENMVYINKKRLKQEDEERNLKFPDAEHKLSLSQFDPNSTWKFKYLSPIERTGCPNWLGMNVSQKNLEKFGSSKRLFEYTAEENGYRYTLCIYDMHANVIHIPRNDKLGRLLNCFDYNVALVIDNSNKVK